MTSKSQSKALDLCTLILKDIGFCARQHSIKAYLLHYSLPSIIITLFLPNFSFRKTQSILSKTAIDIEGFGDHGLGFDLDERIPDHMKFFDIV